MHDPFADRIEKVRSQLASADAKAFTGLDAYKDLVASKLDAVRPFVRCLRLGFGRRRARR